jgi:hypothetical protein
MHFRPVATVEFADSAARVVYEDAHGQFVLDDQGEAWYGVWFVPPEELEVMFGPQPIIVKAQA